MKEYLGKPWARDGYGPDAYSCWGLLCVIQQRHFGKQMPTAIPGLENYKDVYKATMLSGDWQVVLKPQHGDGVLLRGGDDPHVGVWLQDDGGGVIHSLQNAGVIFSSLSKLRLLGMNRLTFYRAR